MERKIISQVRGVPKIDGAGVKLMRVLGPSTMKSFDPILLLDSFDSTNPDDYSASFPMHPHRGIQTISYVYEGKMTHKDSLGNIDTIEGGELQWMVAGSGILHEEIMPASKRMLGVQLWLNLPQKYKMTPPAYYSIKNQDIKEIELENAKLRLLAGEFQGEKGFMGQFLPFDYYDIHLLPNHTQIIPTKEGHFVMLFTLVGEVYVGDTLIPEKTAIKLSDGDSITLKSTDKNTQVLLMSSIPLKESITWGGPIVMNTEKELQEAFKDLESNTFLKEKIGY